MNTCTCTPIEIKTTFTTHKSQMIEESIKSSVLCKSATINLILDPNYKSKNVPSYTICAAVHLDGKQVNFSSYFCSAAKY